MTLNEIWIPNAAAVAVEAVDSKNGRSGDTSPF